MNEITRVLKGILVPCGNVKIEFESFQHEL